MSDSRFLDGDESGAGYPSARTAIENGTYGTPGTDEENPWYSIRPIGPLSPIPSILLVNGTHEQQLHLAE
ncbi:MAG: hypothetical protein JWM11_1770 [Planctomycetaceae bacterium]|nr:hypothetical protein [Planctomycetaceae bacterium]